ncbi:MAG: hypothetical protein CW716_11525 [Candidatus Bathyarchaeum sp.]|nr:MAG: hypothetical protein CW716_11525 [Candidatus Bathyarchaeum sp.]
MNKTQTTIIGASLVFLGVLAIIHHVLICGRLFDLSDVLHHEFFEAILLTAGITLLITTGLTKNE